MNNKDYKAQIEASEKIQRLVSTPEWDILNQVMEIEINRLVKLTEDASFVSEASKNITVLADNLSFRRGIRYVLEYPERLRRAAEASKRKLIESEAKETRH